MPTSLRSVRPVASTLLTHVNAPIRECVHSLRGVWGESTHATSASVQLALRSLSHCRGGANEHS